MKLQTCIYQKEDDGAKFLGVAKVVEFDMPVIMWIIDLKGNKVVSEYAIHNAILPDKNFGNKLNTGI